MIIIRFSHRCFDDWLNFQRLSIERKGPLRFIAWRCLNVNVHFEVNGASWTLGSGLSMCSTWNWAVCWSSRKIWCAKTVQENNKLRGSKENHDLIERCRDDDIRGAKLWLSQSLHSFFSVIELPKVHIVIMHTTSTIAAHFLKVELDAEYHFVFKYRYESNIFVIL